MLAYGLWTRIDGALRTLRLGAVHPGEVDGPGRHELLDLAGRKSGPPSTAKQDGSEIRTTRREIPGELSELLSTSQYLACLSVVGSSSPR